MKQLLYSITIILAFCNISVSQTEFNKEKAEESVKKYMIKVSKDYVPSTFGEFFSQYYNKNLQEIAKTKQVIKYSIVHSFSVKNKITTNMYFHLNESYEVIGKNTDKEMTKLVTDELKNNPKFDSILNSIEKEINK